jgi:uroporphyrinogen decarboxylase
VDKRERLHATLRGGAVDRPAVALWRHFPVDDQDPADLAAATLEWQAQYDFDFVKVTPTSSFCLKDWGAADEWRGSGEGTRDYTRRVIQSPDDWARLPVLDPTTGHLGAQVEALRRVAQGLGGATPFIQTIFSPLSQARHLVGAEHLPAHVRLYPQQVRAGIETITQSTLRFIEACRASGLDGIFYAMQLASARVFSQAEYSVFGEPYDRRLLGAVSDLWLNVVHLHGDEVMFDLAASYGAAVINWHDTEAPPSLAEGLAAVAAKGLGAVCGGLRQWETMVRGTPTQVRAEAARARAQTGGRRFILGTGCVTPIVAPRANLRAARAAVEPN